MSTTVDSLPRAVYWHRDLPPLEAEAAGEHTVEAVSDRVPGTILWDRCRAELSARVQLRLEQEIARLGGRYAHILDEAIDTRRDAATAEAWLHGRFTYMLYR
jgi:hypothetical protein